MVIGIQNDGTLCITSRCDEEHILRLNMEVGNIPVTGHQKPHTSKTSLITLFDDNDKHRQEGKRPAKNCFGMALGRHTQHAGFTYEYATKATALDEIAQVYFEDGYIRHADRPYKALDCAHGKYAEGTGVGFWYFHGGDNQKFKVNESGTVSPIHNANVVLGLSGDCLQLVNTHSKHSDEIALLTFDQCLPYMAHTVKEDDDCKKKLSISTDIPLQFVAPKNHNWSGQSLYLFTDGEMLKALPLWSPTKMPQIRSFEYLGPCNVMRFSDGIFLGSHVLLRKKKKWKQNLLQKCTRF